MVSALAKALQRVQGLVWGHGPRDSSVYFDGHTVVVDVAGRDTGVAAFLVRGLDARNAPTDLFRVDKDGAFKGGGPPVYNVLSYGAKGDGSTDDTAAIQRAIDACRANSLGNTRPPGTIFLPGSNGGTCVGFYAVSSLDLTGLNSAEIVGENVALYASLQTGSGKPVLDMTGSNNVKVKGLVFHGETTGGTQPTVTPSCALLVAETSATGDSNKNSFERCGSVGWFGVAAVYVYGSTDNAFRDCAFQQYFDGQPCLAVDGVNSFAVTSPYKTIASGTRPTGENSFFQCEFHDQFDRATPFVASTIKTVMLHTAYNLRFFGGNVSNAGLRHVDFRGDCRNVLFAGTQFYSDNGTQPPHLAYLNTNNVYGLTFDQCDFPPVTTGLIGALTNSTLDGLAILGKPGSGGLATKIAALTSPGTLRDASVQCDGLAVDVGAAGSILGGVLLSPGAITAGTMTALVTPAPTARVFNSAAISIPNATVTLLTFDSERWDTDALHSTSVDTGRLTCQKAGVYHIAGHVEFASSATGERHFRIRLNGTTFIAIHSTNANASGVHRMCISTEYKLAAADYVELLVYHNSGAALNVNAVGNFGPEFAMTRIG